MAEISQFKVELTEVARLILEREGVTAGRWNVGFNFNVAGMEAGPAPEMVRPSMIVSVDSFIITRAQPDQRGPMIIDLDSPGSVKSK